MAPGGNMHFSSSEEHHLTVGNVVTCSFSMLGSGFIVCSMLLVACVQKKQEGHWGVMEQLHFRLVFLLSCSDICYSIAMLMGDPDDGSSACYFQAVWSSFFEIASLGWVMAIATTLWGSFIRNWPQDPQFEQTLLIRYSIAVFACSFTVTLLPLADGNHYGESGSWCWIDDTDVGQLLRYLTFYAWLWLGFLVICVFYYQLIRHLMTLVPKTDGQSEASCFCCALGSTVRLLLCGDETREGDANFEKMKSVMRRLCAYPLILIVCWTFGSINRLQNSFNPDHPSIGLFYCHMILSNLNGLFNAMAYGFNDSLTEDLKDICCCRHRELENKDAECNETSKDSSTQHTIQMQENPARSASPSMGDSMHSVDLQCDSTRPTLVTPHLAEEESVARL